MRRVMMVGAMRSLLVFTPGVAIAATYIGDDGRDVIRGGSGPDEIKGRGGDDHVYGNESDDLAIGEGT